MRRILGAPVVDYLPAAALWLVTGAYLDLAYHYKPEVRAFPVGVAWIMIMLLTLDLVSHSKTRAGQVLTRWLNPAVQARAGERPARQVSAVLWPIVFVTLMVLVGILVAVPIYLFAALRWRARKSYGACAMGAAGATLFVWLLFSVVLRIALYPGLLVGT
jgi:hypothetical protein